MGIPQPYSGFHEINNHLWIDARQIRGNDGDQDDDDPDKEVRKVQVPYIDILEGSTPYMKSVEGDLASRTRNFHRHHHILLQLLQWRVH